MVASHVPPAGNWPRNPGMCPDWELNCDPLVCRPVLNPLSYTSQGRSVSSLNFYFIYLFIFVERQRHQFVLPLVSAFIGCFLYVP